jgi:SNF family Na+-dependent transporter
MVPMMHLMMVMLQHYRMILMGAAGGLDAVAATDDESCNTGAAVPLVAAVVAVSFRLMLGY